MDSLNEILRALLVPIAALLYLELFLGLLAIFGAVFTIIGTIAWIYGEVQERKRKC